MDVFIYFSFQVIGFGIEDGLYVRICYYYVSGVQFFQVSLVNFCYICYVNMQMSNICVEVGDVFFIVESGDQSWSYFVGGVSFVFFGGVFMIWCFQIQGFNQYMENDVVYDCIVDINNWEQLQFVVVIGQYDKVDQVVRE